MGTYQDQSIIAQINEDESYIESKTAKWNKQAEDARKNRLRKFYCMLIEN